MTLSSDQAFALHVEGLRDISDGAILYSAYMVPSRKRHLVLHEWSGDATLISAKRLFEASFEINAEHSSRNSWSHRISANVKLPEPPFVISLVDSVAYAGIRVKLASTEIVEIVHDLLEDRSSYCTTVMLVDIAAVLFLKSLQRNIASGMLYSLGDSHGLDLNGFSLTDEIDGDSIGTIESIGKMNLYQRCGSKD